LRDATCSVPGPAVCRSPLHLTSRSPAVRPDSRAGFRRSWRGATTPMAWDHGDSLAPRTPRPRPRRRRTPQRHSPSTMRIRRGSRQPHRQPERSQPQLPDTPSPPLRALWRHRPLRARPLPRACRGGGVRSSLFICPVTTAGAPPRLGRAWGRRGRQWIPDPRIPRHDHQPLRRGQSARTCGCPRESGHESRCASSWARSNPDSPDEEPRPRRNG